MTFLLLEIWRHKFPLSIREQVIATRYLSPEIDQNSKKKSFFIPENIFYGHKLYSPMHFPGFQAKQKILHVQFSRGLI